MQITVNGERIDVAASHLEALLSELGYDCSKRSAVAVNETFVPRDSWRQHRVNQSDRIEVLSAIEGG